MQSWRGEYMDHQGDVTTIRQWMHGGCASLSKEASQKAAGPPASALSPPPRQSFRRETTTTSEQ